MSDQLMNCVVTKIRRLKKKRALPAAVAPTVPRPRALKTAVPCALGSTVQQTTFRATRTRIPVPDSWTRGAIAASLTDQPAVIIPPHTYCVPRIPCTTDTHWRDERFRVVRRREGLGRRNCRRREQGGWKRAMGVSAVHAVQRT